MKRNEIESSFTSSLTRSSGDTLSYAPKQLLQKSKVTPSPRKTVKNSNSDTIIRSTSAGIGKVDCSHQQKQQQTKVYVKPKPTQLMLSDLLPTTGTSPLLTSAQGNTSTTKTYGKVEKTPLITSDSIPQLSGARNKVQISSETTKWKKNPDKTVKDLTSTVPPSHSTIAPPLLLRDKATGTSTTFSSRNTNGNNDINGLKLCTDPNKNIWNKNLLINSSFTNKGKPNRLKPRKKKLTSLKKRILTERLQKWKDAQLKEKDLAQSQLAPSTTLSQDPTSNTLRYITDLNGLSSSKIVCLVNFIDAEHDDLTDEDEYSEICSDICRLARLIGPIQGVCIPRQSVDTDTFDSNSTLQGFAFVYFQNSEDAHAARYCWRGMVLGGRTIDALLVSSDEDLAAQTFLPAGASAVSTHVSVPKIALHNILNEDDLADSECMEETLTDIHHLVSTFFSSDRNNTSATFTLDNLYGNEYGILINFCHDVSIETVIHVLNGLYDTKIAGKPLTAEFLFNLKQLSWNNRYDDQHPTNLKSSPTCHRIQDESKSNPMNLPTIFSNDINPVTFAHHQAVVLSNILSDDDMEDEECLDECKGDILTLVKKYGEVSSIDIWKEGPNVGNVLITFASSCADVAAAGLNGLKIGGKCIRAEIAVAEDSWKEHNKISASPPSEVSNNGKDFEAAKTMNNAFTSEPIFSAGGKLIPERWAECKRVPKIGNSASKPVYVQLLNDDAASQLLLDMLGSLMSYQLRSKDDANARSRRRLVLGFREVARGLRAKKIKLVVLANNLDEYEAVSEKTQEVLDACEATETPILFELSKRQLGKALRKTIKISIVGVQNADGAHEQFKKLKALAQNVDKNHIER